MSPLPRWYCQITVWTIDDEGEAARPIHVEPQRQFETESDYAADIIGHVTDGYTVVNDDGINLALRLEENGMYIFANHFKEGY